MQRALFFLFLLYSLMVCSQELANDQIFQLSFDSILKLENDLEYGTTYSKKVFDTHILKAKYLKDTNQLAEAYRKRVWGENFDGAISYVDSAIGLIPSVKDKLFSSKAHYTKGALLYEADYPEESLKEFIKAFHLAQKNGNYEYVVDCLNMIAALKGEYGQEEESILLHEIALKYLLQNKESIDYFDLTYLITLDNIARGYLENKKIDSARVFADRGMKLSEKMKDDETYKKLQILKAQADYYDGNFIKSRDSLLVHLNDYEGYSKADILFYLGMIEGKLDNVDKKQRYFEQLDSILQVSEFPQLDNVSKVFQFLLKTAISNNESEKEKKYIKRLIYYDSLSKETQRNIRKVTLIDFDLPVEEASKKTFIDEINYKRKTINFFYWFSGILVAFLLTFYIRHVKIQKRLRNIMHKGIEPEKSNSLENAASDIDIDSEVISKILSMLNNWEEKKGFLNQGVNQTSLAKELGTNSSYLSKIINFYKNLSFSNYLKDIRITYALNFLKENPNFIENKSIIQIAEHFGFNSQDVFSRAIKDKIGVTPAMFLKQLKKGNL
ncbi:AraC family transcriptional regulator [Flagellimonas sp. S3867]|uniref:helix-turn-helix domain-containing protein n=1 Tax=Flagellimonas sp. S3867 TaxID=2768063 RepID=UPI00168420FD|nr:helix-turn-helix transcriptional regulator [Flagellimonas sp. S3867]